MIETTHPVVGRMRMPKPPFNFIGQNEFPKSHAPSLGEHSREILLELEVAEEDILRMEQREKSNREMMKAMTLSNATNKSRK